jgi:chromosome segregation ATPase
MRSKRRDEYAHESAFTGDVDQLAARVDMLASMVREASGALVAVRGEVATARKELDGKLRDDTAQTLKALSRVQDDIAKLRSAPKPAGKAAPTPDARVADELSVLADRLGTLSGMVNATAGQLAAREGSLERLRDDVSDESAKVHKALDEVKRELAALGVRVAASATKTAAPALDPGVAGKIEALSDRMQGLSASVRETSGGLVAATGAISRTNERIAAVEARLAQSSNDAREAHAALERVISSFGDRLTATKSTEELSASLANAVQALGDRIDTVSGVVRSTAGRLASREELAAELEQRLDALAGRVDALASDVTFADAVAPSGAEIDELSLDEALAPMRETVSTIVARLDELNVDATGLDSDVAAALGRRVTAVETAQEELRADVTAVETASQERAAALAARADVLESTQRETTDRQEELAAAQAELQTADAEIVARQDELVEAVAATRAEFEQAQTELVRRQEKTEVVQAEVTERQDALEEGHLVLSDRQSVLEDKHLELADELARVEATANEALNRPAADAAPVLRDLAEKLERIDTDRRVVADHLAAVEDAWEEERQALRARIEEISVTAADAPAGEDADRVIRELTVRLGRLEREHESVTELASLADGWTSSLGTLAARVEYGLIKLQQAAAPSSPDDAQELVELAGRVAAMERDRDTVLGEIARATETWASERAALHERVAELSARIITGPVDALATGSATAELGDASQELDRLRIALEGMRMRLAYHEKAVAEMSGGSVTSRLDDLSARLDRLANAVASAGASGASLGGADGLLGPDVDDLLKRLARAESAVVEQRSDMLGHLEKIAARMDWRLRRLETPDESHISV